MSRMNRPVKLALLTLGTGAAVAAFSLSSPSPAVAQPATAAAPASSSATFSVDAVHSSVIFKIKHNGVSNFYGRFNKASGTFNWDPAKPEATTADITIDAASIDSNFKKRDDHLNSPDFFNTKEFPSITFKSKSMKKAGDDWDITGDLTLLGKTKEVTAKFMPVGQKTGDKGSLAGFEVHLNIKRSDFGMTKFIAEGTLGDEVHISAGFEGGHK